MAKGVAEIEEKNDETLPLIAFLYERRMKVYRVMS